MFLFVFFPLRFSFFFFFVFWLRFNPDSTISIHFENRFMRAEELFYFFFSLDFSWFYYSIHDDRGHINQKFAPERFDVLRELLTISRAIESKTERRALEPISMAEGFFIFYFLFMIFIFIFHLFLVFFFPFLLAEYAANFFITRSLVVTPFSDILWGLHRKLLFRDECAGEDTQRSQNRNFFEIIL